MENKYITIVGKVFPYIILKYVLIGKYVKVVLIVILLLFPLYVMMVI